MNVEAKVRSVWPETTHDRWMNPSYESGLVSVIVPTYNRADRLPATLDSAWQQTYRPIELIVVDDGSTDDTVETVKRWADARDDGQFEVRVFQQENRGPSAARNLGLIRSGGEYIQFLDSDDRLHPQKIEAHVATLEAELPCDYVWSTHTSFSLSGGEPNFSDYDIDALVSASEFTPALGLFAMTGNLWDGFYRRNMCRRTGPMHESLTRMEDMEYNIRMSTLHPPGRYVDADLVARGEHEESRLTGLRHGEDGIQTGFASLGVIEDTLDHFDVGGDAPVRTTLANFYLGLAYEALHVSNRSSFERAVAAAKRNRDGVFFRTQLWILRTLRDVLGDTMTARLWGQYANFNE